MMFELGKYAIVIFGINLMELKKQRLDPFFSWARVCVYVYVCAPPLALNDDSTFDG